ncbi:MAG: sigma-70 family RNA polymerase sigma factor [Clostridia bacterium]|nr:sigma-70 family RNA polymerase sigma factor [Clostridia bacterium]
MKRMQLNDYGEILGGLQAYEQSQRIEDPRRREQIRRAIRRAAQQELTPRQREMVQLHYFEGIPMVQIAKRLGVNKSTVSRVIGSARRRIAPCIRYFM